MGLSVFLPQGEGYSLEVDLSYADYDHVEYAEGRDDKIRNGWKRVPHGPVVVSVPFDAAKLAKGGWCLARAGSCSRASCAPPTWTASRQARAC